MRPILAAALMTSLGACATAPMEEGGPTTADNGNDCAVIAAVAKDHFQFGPTNTPPPIKFEDGYDPRCDWSRYGLAFEPWREQPGADPRQSMRWVSFDRPRYDGQGALIAVSIIHGPLAGQGSECRVRSGFAGWTVSECRATWVS